MLKATGASVSVATVRSYYDEKATKSRRLACFLLLSPLNRSSERRPAHIICPNKEKRPAYCLFGFMAR